MCFGGIHHDKFQGHSNNRQANHSQLLNESEGKYRVRSIDHVKNCTLTMPELGCSYNEIHSLFLANNCRYFILFCSE